MPPLDPGQEALVLLRRALGVGSGWMVDHAFHWVFWGALQSAWVEPAVTGDGRSVQRVHLRTRMVDGFSGSSAQVTVLATCLPHPSLSGVVTGNESGKLLMLATAVTVDEGSLEACVRLLDWAARSQANEARRLAEFARQLAAADFTPLVDATALLPEAVLASGEMLFREARPAHGRWSWSSRAMALCVDELGKHSEVNAMRTPWGLSATLSLGWTAAAVSTLEVRADVGRPLMGPGISIGLWTPVRGGPIDAIGWNEREMGPDGPPIAVGGWGAPEGGYLVHRSFCPAALSRPELVQELVPIYVARARRANTAVAARE